MLNNSVVSADSTSPAEPVQQRAVVASGRGQGRLRAEPPPGHRQHAHQESGPGRLPGKAVQVESVSQQSNHV